MTAQHRPQLAVDPVFAAAMASAGVGMVWYAVLMRALWAAAALSPICGHAGPTLAHCAPCYAALSLVAAGLATAAARALAPRAAPAKTRR